MILDNRIKKQVESAYRRYTTAKSVESDKKVDIYDSGLTANLGTNHGSGITSNPTEAKALKIISLEQSAAWNIVVEKTMIYYAATGRDKFLKARYFEKKSVREVCYRFNIDERTYYHWRDEITVRSALIAAQYGLIKID